MEPTPSYASKSYGERGSRKKPRKGLSRLFLRVGNKEWSRVQEVVVPCVSVWNTPGLWEVRPPGDKEQLYYLTQAAVCLRWEAHRGQALGHGQPKGATPLPNFSVSLLGVLGREM